jgi:microtubule-associated protein-like 6
MEEVGEGDQRLAVIPFKAEVEHSIPSGFKAAPNAGDKPNGNLKLKYAHGFRSFDTRGNLKYLNNDHIAFTTAALGVVMDKNENTQSFFNLHDDDVVSMAVHPSRDIVATGQMAAKGKAKLIDIYVWNVTTKEVLAHLNNFHRGAIRKLEFSPAGDKLLTIGEDP